MPKVIMVHKEQAEAQGRKWLRELQRCQKALRKRRKTIQYHIKKREQARKILRLR